jgi:hypothetical protein
VGEVVESKAARGMRGKIESKAGGEYEGED